MFKSRQRAPCIKQTNCSNRMTFIENVQLNNCNLGFGYYFFLMTYIWAKMDIKFEETSEYMSFSAFLTTSNTWLV